MLVVSGISGLFVDPEGSTGERECDGVAECDQSGAAEEQDELAGCGQYFAESGRGLAQDWQELVDHEATCRRKSHGQECDAGHGYQADQEGAG